MLFVYALEHHQNKFLHAHFTVTMPLALVANKSLFSVSLTKEVITATTYYINLLKASESAEFIFHKLPQP